MQKLQLLQNYCARFQFYFTKLAGSVFLHSVLTRINNHFISGGTFSFRLSQQNTKQIRFPGLIIIYYVYEHVFDVVASADQKNSRSACSFQHIVVVTKKPPMCQIMCSSLYYTNGSIEGRCIN